MSASKYDQMRPGVLEQMASMRDAATQQMHGEVDIMRPDWEYVYRDCAHSPERDNELVRVTRETARLARSAIAEQQRQDAYHNFAAARRELELVLNS